MLSDFRGDIWNLLGVFRVKFGEIGLKLRWKFLGFCAPRVTPERGSVSRRLS